MADTDVIFDRGLVKQRGGQGPSINASQLMTSISAKIMFTNLSNSICLMQTGPLVAPVFVIQQPPSGHEPWWIISIVQYHSIKPTADECKINLWRGFTLESIVGEDITKQTVYLYPLSTSRAGLIKKNYETRFNIRPDYHAHLITRRTGHDALSLKDDIQGLSYAEYLDELEELTGRRKHGLLSADKIRDNYPTFEIGEVIEQVSTKYTLETEVKKLLGVHDDLDNA